LHPTLVVIAMLAFIGGFVC